MKFLLLVVSFLFLASGFSQVKTFDYSDASFEVDAIRELDFRERNGCGYDPKVYPELDSLARFLASHEKIRIAIEIYTDQRGSEERNLAISQLRAHYIRDYLVGKSIDSNRIVAKGYGEKYPVIDCFSDSIKCSEEEYLMSRRTIIRIIDIRVTFEYSDAYFEVGQAKRIRNIYFIFAKAELDPISYPALDSLVSFLKDHKKLIVEIGDHTDARGSKTRSTCLSCKRAEAVRDYLITHGIKEKRVTAKGHGESQPLNGCVDGVKCSEEQHLENRRMEVKILEI